MPTWAIASPTPRARSPDNSPPDDTAPGDEPTEPETDTTRPPIDEGATAAELLAEAEALFTEAEAGLRANGDLGAYQTRIDEARDLIARASSCWAAYERDSKALPRPSATRVFTSTTNPATRLRRNPS